MKLTPYLYFKGNCEHALRFYEECGLGTIRDLRRFAGSAMENRDGGVWRDKVLHSLFEGPSVRFFASDGPDSEPMKGCALLLDHPDPRVAGAMFDVLSAGGHVTVPFKVQFWGEHYGNFTDKFGVQWALRCPKD
jgi:PhnB protein